MNYYDKFEFGVIYEKTLEEVFDFESEEKLDEKIRALFPCNVIKSSKIMPYSFKCIICNSPHNKLYPRNSGYKCKGCFGKSFYKHAKLKIVAV
jgi:hypothetical protein